MTQLLDDLKAVRELLAVPERWTQNTHARGVKGAPVSPVGGMAVCWCIDGAALRVAGNQHSLRYREMDEAIGSACETVCYAFWNDRPHRTHADVLALLDKAIAAAEKQP